MYKVIGRSRAGGEGEGGHWLSVSDLMAGLMMVFLFIAVALMRNTVIERAQIKEVAVAYQETKVAIYDALTAEFSNDLPDWDATIDEETLAFEFKSPEVVFGQGQTRIQPKFQRILSDFFPRYVAILSEFKEPIDEIRIEGHTSSVWNGFVDDSDAYFLNMDLSQDRTRSVLQYVYNLPAIEQDREWVRHYFAAVGFSSSRLIHDAQGIEDEAQSRRVTFRVITNAETQIKRILEQRDE
jgi:outer membrane protein OmpA-like peptidoglycan-associated protein